VLAVLAFAPAASASSWLPSGQDATWTYRWTDSVYSAAPTTEKVTVKSRKGNTFTLEWTTVDQGNSEDAVASAGTVTFQTTNAGIENTDWSSTAPPGEFPVLCSQAASCGNALTSTLYNVIWGSRRPVLQEPLLAGLSWESTGGARGDVASSNTYLGTEKITVPAFPSPVTAAKVRSRITQAGALGDPYGSGLRTIWWVYGVGPVKVEFQHAGGASAPVTTSVLESTNLTPAAPPTDADYFPFRKGLKLTYRWTNSKHMKEAAVERFTIDTVVNNTARFKVAHVSGPIRVAGTYGFSKRLDGVTNLWGTTQSATLVKFPGLGPRSAAPAKRNRFVTPFDLMNFGINPILGAYPTAKDGWPAATRGTDFATYGVTGKTEVVGLRRVKVPGGSFTAVVVRSTLTQKGFPFGSGTRTCWFAPGKGLVKLTFAHRDGSVSTVELVK
jgi:hypothetical protein